MNLGEMREITDTGIGENITSNLKNMLVGKR